MAFLSFSTLGIVAAVLAVFGVWHESIRARETANRVALDACRRSSLQLLDGTVALAALRPRLDRTGFSLERTYVFDYSAGGGSRATGFLIMRGREVRHVGFEAG